MRHNKISKLIEPITKSSNLKKRCLLLNFVDAAPELVKSERKILW